MAQHMPRENHDSESHVYPSVHCSAIYNRQDREATKMSFDR